MKTKYHIKNTIKPIHVFFTIIGYILYLTVALCLLAVMSIFLLYSIFFDKHKKVLSYIIKGSVYMFSFINFTQHNQIERHGLKAPVKGERRIYVVNHASIFDSLMMFLLPGSIKSVMKESYVRVPVIGWISLLSGNIIVKEEANMGGQLDMFMNAVEKLENGSCIVIYPEGTRSKDSKVGRFSQGTFMIARETKADIVPVVFDTWNTIRPGSLWIRDVKPTLEILDTISYDEYKSMDNKKLANMVRMRIIQGLVNLRDSRRLKEKKYYRKEGIFNEIDNAMRDDAAKIKEKIAES